MDNEELQKLKELTKNAQEGARNGWPFYPEALAKTMKPDVVRELIELAERATQPAQDQVAAVRAVPDEQINRIAGRNGLYRAMTPDDKTCKSMVKRFVGEILAAAAPSPQPDLLDAQRAEEMNDKACSHAFVSNKPVFELTPQPELSGSIDTPKFITTAKVGKAVITPRGMEVIGEGMVSFSPAPQPAESVDTEEFRTVIAQWVHAEHYAHPTPSPKTNAFRTMVDHINAWKDAACAATAQDKTDYANQCIEACEKWRQRATDAETKLAAIQSQAAGDALLEAVRSVLREGLDSANVHPCDSNNDDARARQLSPLMQNLYRAAMREQQP